jgi:ferritin
LLLESDFISFKHRFKQFILGDEMITEKIEKALNQHLNEELYSSYLYLSMCAYFQIQNLSGFANWMKVQYQEENFHAMKFYDYIIQKGGKITLLKIDQPKTSWSSTLEVFEETLKHEQKITALINNLVDLAIQEKDHATVNFLNWFVNEQVEEEANVEKILSEIKMVGDNKTGLFMMDRELGTRVFVPDTAAA